MTFLIFMQKISQTVFSGVMICSVLFPLSGCSNNTKTAEIDSSIAPSSSEKTPITSSVINEKKGELVVVPERCIACQKCYNIDPEHFIRGTDGRAIVISQENLDTPQVKFAERVCPTDAIELSVS